MAGYVYNISIQPDAMFTIGILAFVDGSIRLVPGTLGADNTKQLEFGSLAITPFVGQHNGSTTTAKKSILEQHASVISMIKILRQVLRRNNKRNLTRMRAQDVLRKFDSNKTRRATHTTYVISHDISTHVETIHDHGAKRRSGREETTVDNQNIYLWR
jgi:hypothetical protein